MIQLPKSMTKTQANELASEMIDELNITSTKAELEAMLVSHDVGWLFDRALNDSCPDLKQYFDEDEEGEINDNNYDMTHDAFFCKLEKQLDNEA